MREHLEAIFIARSDVAIHNTYGPTEATVSCTVLRLTEQDYEPACGNSVAIGAAIPGMGLHLIGGEDEDEGEIVLVGPQLARGYWDDEEATTDAFRQIRIGSAEHLAYHTGDWAVRRGQHIFFATRMDRQVKILGNRLELGDVDAAIRACGVQLACTVAVNGLLISFVEKQQNLDLSALRCKLADHLPAYAVPESFKVLDNLPRNANDKIDAAILQEMARQKGGS